MPILAQINCFSNLLMFILLEKLFHDFFDIFFSPHYNLKNFETRKEKISKVTFLRKKYLLKLKISLL